MKKKKNPLKMPPKGLDLRAGYNKEAFKFCNANLDEIRLNRDYIKNLNWPEAEKSADIILKFNNI